MAALLNRLRKAIQTSGRTRYRISRATGVAESVLSRFVNGQTGLSVETAEKVAEYLGLEITLRPKSGKGA